MHKIRLKIRLAGQSENNVKKRPCRFYSARSDFIYSVLAPKQAYAFLALIAACAAARRAIGTRKGEQET